MPESPDESEPRPSRPPAIGGISTYTLGTISAMLSLFVVPEVFGSAAIILGAYTWRREQNSNRGLYVLVLGIAFMLVGIYFTAYFGLFDLIPS